ncbi:conserved Plasmodium protein, unknown function [Plasmodium ovale wallikeri]|uniref:Uncharacterized protein n=1 Tax=Plasmodium ovale wallikeri TaxID=864142 RepID=A0A1A9AKN7_PLAOA|nr:conserved Plasmodium protein, unknown function [Plasmodium ovale wallikeri]
MHIIISTLKCYDLSEEFLIQSGKKWPRKLAESGPVPKDPPLGADTNVNGNADMDERMNRNMDADMDERMNRNMDADMDERMNRNMDADMDERMNRNMDADF